MTTEAGAEGEVGRLARLERGRYLIEHLILCGLHEVDLLAGLLLEGGDDLPDRFVFLGIEPLLPPHDEVGGLGADRRQNDRRRDDENAAPHNASPRIDLRSMRWLGYSLRISLIRAIASSTACSGLMPSVATR
jgi:hypothetical protein